LNVALEDKGLANDPRNTAAFNGEHPGLDAQGRTKTQGAHVENFYHNPVGKMHAQ
jgi:hypothetical protein